MALSAAHEATTAESKRDQAKERTLRWCGSVACSGLRASLRLKSETLWPAWQPTKEVWCACGEKTALSGTALLASVSSRATAKGAARPMTDSCLPHRAASVPVAFTATRVTSFWKRRRVWHSSLGHPPPPPPADPSSSSGSAGLSMATRPPLNNVSLFCHSRATGGFLPPPTRARRRAVSSSRSRSSLTASTRCTSGIRLFSRGAA